MEREGYTLERVRASIVEKGFKPEVGRSTAALYTGNVDPDLILVHFLLASEGANKNRDLFSRKELIEAKDTPVGKPFNVEHNLEEDKSYIGEALFNRTKNTIIGHMVGSAIVDSNMKVLTDQEIADLDMTEDYDRPDADKIHLVATVALYHFYFPQTVDDLQKGIEDGSLFVSMECWFKDHTFIVDGKEYAKDHEDLEDRWKGGLIFNGSSINRRFDGLLFGGCAVVRNPAGEMSTFLDFDEAEERLKALANRHDELHILYEFRPTEELEREHSAVASEIASIKAKLLAL